MVEEDEGEQETLKVWRKDMTLEISPSKYDLDHQKAIGDAFRSRYLQSAMIQQGIVPCLSEAH